MLPHFDKLTLPPLDPAEFATFGLGLNLYDWQRETLEDIGAGRRVVLRANNGSGKSAVVVAGAALWALWAWPRAKVPITSASWLQLQKQVFPALHSFQGCEVLRDYEWNQTEIKTPEGGFIVGFSTSEAGRAEGWHWGGPDAPLFYVIDEAKSVDQGIFDARARCTRQLELTVSSPGGPFGPFYNCHRKSRRFYSLHKATSYDCPHIPREKIEEDIEQYGEDDPLIRSMHFAEFSEDEDRKVISMTALERALERFRQQNLEGEFVAFIDFAAGGDENVIAIRKGNAVWIVEAWRDKNTTRAVKKMIGILRELGLKPGQVWGDADGLGGPVCDYFAECGFPINRFHNNAPAKDSDHYANRISEFWYQGANRIKTGAVVLCNGLERDDTFAEQITTRPIEWDTNGRLALMPKSRPRAGKTGAQAEVGNTMKALGLPSPDRADAVLGAIMVGKHMVGAIDTDDLKHSRTNTPFSTPVTRF